MTSSQHWKPVQPELIGLSAKPDPIEPPFAGLDPEEDDGRPKSDTWGGFDGVQNPANGDDDVTRDFTGPSQSQHPSNPFRCQYAGPC